MLEEPGARRPPSVLGFSLTIVRVIQGWKQWELAAAVGTTRSIISGQEKGKLRLTREDLAIYAERMDYYDDLDAVISFAARRLAQRMSRGAADPEAAERRAIA